ncbi:DUF4422 domain-containing protein [Pectobacterium atrosepticum]|uniref:DUF4422 domain-containing protein n=1 Tax=Pectobacterium atrosepticum TaxID=29471 RepID=UPI00039FE8BE|nr:DUF4422 domain-containing protein [Pectobacterium atrosepticum]
MNKIFVVTHKNYEFPLNSMYVPIQVGHGNVNGIIYNDRLDDNISHLNPYFCELTALYWIWKNDNADVIGLVHYRRYFSTKKKTVKVKNSFVMDESEVLETMKTVDIIVAKPRNYIISTIESHYRKAHYSEDFDMLRNAINKIYPDYIRSFDKVMFGRKLSLYNMFVAKRDIIEQYCAWAFDILFYLEGEIRYHKYDSYQKRVFGFMAERLFNVWLEHHKSEINIQYNKVVNVEGEAVFSKGINFLKRQFTN